jgi:hypothetical protein
MFGLRSVTATGLSLWMGVLACLLGCAKPVVASTKRPAAEQAVANCPDDDGPAGDSCCQHGHDPQGSPDKGAHHAKSCCPTETALAERKSASIAHTIPVDVVTLAMLAADASSLFPASANATAPTPWRAGRDILRRVRVLRI